MDRRDTLLALLALAAAPLAAEAQQAAKVARIGYLTSSLGVSPHLTEAIWGATMILAIALALVRDRWMAHLWLRRTSK